MSLNTLIEKLENLNSGLNGVKYDKMAKSTVLLLKELKKRDLTLEEQEQLIARFEINFEKIQSQKDVKMGLSKMKSLLTNDFGFVPLNYYSTLGSGVGLALGTCLGISFGVPFSNGLVFGPIVGSVIGLLCGLFAGLIMDQKKQVENRVLKNL
ncbi:hypothetical protein [Croceivirga thetidis]|uniref:Glycine zipper family protein n=1 Tax=Croceivirga thetidis TaxID=2721623 RepID=A0ABX1GTH8_9FLAO|nr:hypothetical protein [Croceivirga thetidis]NKI33260.1 hypothetical protein [Croceivirga thetidis]